MGLIPSSSRQKRMAAKPDLDPKPEGLNREQALFMAKLAEAAERYEEMVLYMKRLKDLGIKGDELSVEERNLISVGYKNLMSNRRQAWRTIDAEEKNKAGTPEAETAKAYKPVIEKELFSLVEEVSTEIVNTYVQGPQTATNPEVLGFFHKMEGDYNRYGAEIMGTSEYEAKARKAYDAAQDICSKNPEVLATTNPIRLGLALNHSVFFYEICDEKEMAAQLAQTAFDDAINELETLDEEAYRDSTLIMQLLKDNLSLWNESEDQ